MRNMAWERAKGELKSMLHTYGSSEEEERIYIQFRDTLKEFVSKVEGDGLHE
jgi:hypothetical protein